MLGFTGTVNGRPPGVMEAGMGRPPSIYATELFSQFGVERIIRVSTAGALSPKVKVGDVIVATGAHGLLHEPAAHPGRQLQRRGGLPAVRGRVPGAARAQAGGAVHLGTVMSQDRHFTPGADQSAGVQGQEWR